MGMATNLERLLQGLNRKNLKFYFLPALGMLTRIVTPSINFFEKGCVTLLRPKIAVLPGQTEKTEIAKAEKE